MVTKRNYLRNFSVMKVAEGLSLSLFIVVSLLPLLVIFAETVKSTLGFGFTLPASFIGYMNRVTGNTIFLALSVTAVSLLAGIPAGYFLARLNQKTAGIFLVLLTIPLAAPSLVSAVMIRSLFERTGSLYVWFARIGLIMPSSYGFFGLAATQLLHTIPYTILLVRAGFLAIPRSLEEAALSLGARPSIVFQNVLIPFVFPHILTACTMMLLYSVGDLGAAIVLGGPYKVFSSEIYVNFISNWGDKRVPLIFAVWAIVVFLAVLFVLARVKTLVATRQGNPGGQYPALSTGRRRVGIVYLALLSLVMLFPFLYTFSKELLLPIPAANVNPLVHDWTSVKNSLLLSLFVVPPMLVSGIFIANAVKSRKHKVLLTGIILVPAVLPGVLLGFGLLRTLHFIDAAEHATALLVVILGVALMVRGLPYVVIVLQSAINAGTLPLEDTARSLGASPATAFITVTLPQVRPVLAIAAVVGVFACVTELSASLIIYPPGWQTMSMFIAYYMEEGFVRRAVFMAFILLAVVESTLVLSGILSAKSARNAKSAKSAKSSEMLNGSGAQSRDRMVFLSAFTALEPDKFPSGRASPRRQSPFGLRIHLWEATLSSLHRLLHIRLPTPFLTCIRARKQEQNPEIWHLRTENAALRRELAKAMHRNVSMQINPHFFFNTLNTIVSLVQKNQSAAIGTVGSLASLFRYALDASESDALPLSKEIEYIRTYLEIEKMRFGDKLHYTVNAPDHLFGTMIPPLLIQPLVENAIKYGRGEDGKTYLLLSIQGEPGRLIITIADYGSSKIDPELIAASERTGIRSVRQRIESITGGSLRFYRNEPHGLRVEMRLSAEGAYDQDTDC